MPYDPIIGLQIITGLLSIGISFYMGMRIIFKYKYFKRVEFILVGITGLLISEPLWVYTIKNIIYLFNPNPLPVELINIVSLIGQPVALFTWLYALSILMYEKQKKLLLYISLVYGIFFEFVLFVNPSFSIEICLFLIIFLIFLGILIVLLTGLLFARENLKTDSAEQRFRGILLIYAFISYAILTILISTFFLTPIQIMILHILTIFSALAFYYGFITPNWVKNRFFKSENLDS